MDLEEIARRLEAAERPMEVESLGGPPDRPLPIVRVATRNPLVEWRWFRDHSVQIGCWPVLLSNSEPTRRLLVEALGHSEPVGEILRRASHLDGAAEVQSLFDEEFEEYDPSEMEGEWPGEVPGNRSYSLLPETVVAGAGLLGLLGKPPVHQIALIPANKPWEVFAWLGYGGFNACPPAEVHTALHRQWHQRWGTEPVALAHDTLECRVEKRPGNQNEALDLAWLQYRYCTDLVEQGVGTVSNLAAGLMGSEVWYFWWD